MADPSPVYNDLRTLKQRVDRLEITHHREVRNHDGGSGGNDGMESRVAKLEAAMEHIIVQLSEIRADIRELRGDDKKLLAAVIACFLILMGAMTTGYVRLDDRIEAKFEALDRKVDTSFDGISSKLDQLADHRK